MKFNALELLQFCTKPSIYYTASPQEMYFARVIRSIRQIAGLATIIRRRSTWKRHAMETFSQLLVIYEGNQLSQVYTKDQ